MTRALTTLLFGALLAAALTPPVRALPSADEDRAITHALNRIGYGPRPGDVDRVRRDGLEAYIDQQLRPDRVPDSAMVSRLAGLTTLNLASREIAATFELPALQARRDRKQEAASRLPSGASPDERDVRRMAADRAQANLPLMDLSQQKLLRAVFSERQLQEVLVDFWFNHFNVDARKGPVRYMLTEYERDALRPHVLGHFRDLLEATAKSPAMLFYLDNWQNVDRQASPGDAPRPTGLNENYGRELLELHTLGVDGGYTQKDVTEVARAFTGWSIAKPRLGGGFRFVSRLHDNGDKVVLGHVVNSGGEQDGLRVLDILARHPSTAHFIATKLARRFVSDTPPEALIERAAARFRETDGDIRAVIALLLHSPEFAAPQAYRAKVKSPFEFVVSALRVTGAEVTDARALVHALHELGMPLYQCQPPTGYKDTADAWMNTGALVARMNHALALAEDDVRGVRISNGPARATLLSGDLSPSTRRTIAQASTPRQALALTLGSPEFQRR